MWFGWAIQSRCFLPHVRILLIHVRVYVCKLYLFITAGPKRGGRGDMIVLDVRTRDYSFGRQQSYGLPRTDDRYGTLARASAFRRPLREINSQHEIRLHA